MASIRAGILALICLQLPGAARRMPASLHNLLEETHHETHPQGSLDPQLQQMPASEHESHPHAHVVEEYLLEETVNTTGRTSPSLLQSGRIHGSQLQNSSVQRMTAPQEFEDFMVRRCIVTRVETWQLGEMPAGVPEITDRPGGVTVQNSLKELLARYLQLEDALSNHRSNSGVMKKFVSKFRSSTKESLTEKRNEVDKELRLLGFDYKAIKKRCANGFTEQTYQCMCERASAYNKQIVPNSLVPRVPLDVFVRARINLEDQMLYKGKYSAGAKLKMTAAWKAVKATIKKYHFKFKNTQKACFKETQEAAKAWRKNTIDDLSAGTDTSWFRGSCSEVEDKMCPEGTSAQTKRRINAAKGAGAAFVAFWGAQVLKVLGGGLVGVIIGIPGGPAGMAAGGASGLAFGAVVPGPTIISAAAFFWASTGPSECACFPRDCSYDETLGSCALEANTDAPSKNPYGRAMPYMSTKCVRKKKNPKKCEMQACEEEDYASPLVLPKSQLFGRIGAQNGEVFNCLSTDGRLIGALPLKTTLDFWNGANNVAAARVELFRSILPPVPELRDNTEMAHSLGADDKSALSPPDEAAGEDSPF